MLYDSIEQTIGNTPLVNLGRIEVKFGLKVRMYAKLEYFNPGGSIKDRPALQMLDDAYEKGLIKEGDTIVEPTSGNTGIGLALAACKYNLKVILTMPDSVSRERIGMMKALGAVPVLTPRENGIKGAIDKAIEIKNDIPGSYMPLQFTNKSNPKAHYINTAAEIIRDLGSAPDIFVAGVGTGGTLTGCGRYFKEHGYATEMIAVEPFESSVISGNAPGRHGIQGIGAGFVPEILDTGIIDRILRVTTEDAKHWTKILSAEEKITGGISAGAALCASMKAIEGREVRSLVFIVPDTTERYLSTGLFDD
ncbi:MAG TPA: cysteine synthase family protein [Clostridia bacterium]|nr:cysteine synthase family protein [Clostridia bacterium]